MKRTRWLRFHSRKTPAAAATSYVALKALKHKVSPYDRAVLGGAIGFFTSFYQSPIGTGIFIAGGLQLTEVTTAKLVVNRYRGEVYAIGEKGKLIKLAPGQTLLTGMDGLAIPGQRTVYKCVDGCYYGVDASGKVSLVRGLFQGLAHTARGGGYKDAAWCTRQHNLGNPAWLQLYEAANGR